MKIRPSRSATGQISNVPGVLAAVRWLCLRCEREFGVAYASDAWPGTLSDLTLALLLERVGIRWRHVPLEGLCEVVWPPICGIHVMHVDRLQTPAQRRFAVRHGLGHVLAGHVADLAYAHDGHDWRLHQETVADLFAMMDLIHDERIAQLRTAGYLPAELERWIYADLAAHWTDGWTPERLADRAALRMRIHQEAADDR